LEPTRIFGRFRNPSEIRVVSALLQSAKGSTFASMIEILVLTYAGQHALKTASKPTRRKASR
jgi:hypothetical protein